MTASNTRKGINRRSVLAGSAGLGLVSILPTGFMASTALASGKISARGKVRTCETNLSKYLCETVHPKIAAQLDEIILDPAVDGERTALALMEARCPGCNGRVHPAMSRISAVVPKWNLTSSGNLKGAMA